MCWHNDSDDRDDENRFLSRLRLQEEVLVAYSLDHTNDVDLGTNDQISWERPRWWSVVDDDRTEDAFLYRILHFRTVYITRPNHMKTCRVFQASYKLQ